MANVIKVLTKAMTSLWSKTGSVPNNGLFIGAAPQGTYPLYATWNIIPPGNLIMSMGSGPQGITGTQGSNIDDMHVQVSYFSSQQQGLGMCMDLFGYGDGLWHRQTLSMTDVNLVGMYRIGTYVYWYNDVEKLWQTSAMYRVMVG